MNKAIAAGETTASAVAIAGRPNMMNGGRAGEEMEVLVWAFLGSQFELPNFALFGLGLHRLFERRRGDDTDRAFGRL